MMNTEPLEELLRAILASGRLKDERPLSGIVISQVEAGKSQLIKGACLKAGTVFYTTDVTAYGIIRDTNNLKDFCSGKYTHIVIPDLIVCTSRSAATVKTFESFMMALIEEGIVNLSTYAVKVKAEDIVNARAGLITAIPKDVFGDKRRHWNRTGFLSRALPISYDYSVSTRIKILDYIKEQRHLKEEVKKLKLPRKSKLISLSKDIANKVEPYALMLANAQQLYGFRHQRQLQTLIKAIALLDGKDAVEWSHFGQFEKLMNYVNLDHNQI
jgi:hypothetical protein